MKRLFIILLTILFLNSSLLPLYAYTQIPEYLCEIGMKFYQQGQYDEALGEFKKALMVQPNYEPALKYIQMIEQTGVIEEKKAEIIPPTFRTTAPTPAGAMREMMDLIEIQREMIQERQLVQPRPVIPLLPEVRVEEMVKKKKPPIPLMILTLDESLGKISQPIEIEQAKTIILLAKIFSGF